MVTRHLALQSVKSVVFAVKKNEAPVCISNKAMCGDKLKVMMVVVVVVMVALGTMRVEPVD